MWHCPSCGAPQAETARCWVCHRSSTTCSTCRHFRTSLSADVGWCALDPKRRPLTGAEQRGCWQERHTAAEAAPLLVESRRGRRSSVAADQEDRDGALPAHREFIPVELLGPITAPASPAQDAEVDAIAALPASVPILADLDDGWAERTSLFGEPEA
jgi:hypothetical protein